jgi:hypothetical protein
MASTAQTAQNSVVRINTAVGTTKTVTAISKANPCVVTATHDYTVGDIVVISGVVGMTQLNGRAFVVSAISTTVSFTLGGVDSTNYTTYVSGGSAIEQTMTAIGNIKDFNIQPDASTEIDITNLASTRKEFILGLAGSWVMTCAMDTDTTDTGQTELVKAQNDGLSRTFTVTLGTSGKVFAGVGYVKDFGAAGSADAVVGGTLSVRGTGQPSWFV